MQQSVVHGGTGHLDTLRQHEGALELPGRDATVEIDTVLVIGLPAANDQLIVLDLNI